MCLPIFIVSDRFTSESVRANTASQAIESLGLDYPGYESGRLLTHSPYRATLRWSSKLVGFGVFNEPVYENEPFVTEAHCVSSECDL